MYDNRHTRPTKWLNDGVPPARVAQWAGSGAAVFLAACAHCVDGRLPAPKRWLEAAGGLPEAPGADWAPLRPRTSTRMRHGHPSTRPPAKTR